MRAPEINSGPVLGAVQRQYNPPGQAYLPFTDGDKGKTFYPSSSHTSRIQPELNEFKAPEYFLTGRLPNYLPHKLSSPFEGHKPQLYPFNPHHV